MCICLAVCFLWAEFDEVMSAHQFQGLQADTFPMLNIYESAPCQGVYSRQLFGDTVCMLVFQCCLADVYCRSPSTFIVIFLLTFIVIFLSRLTLISRQIHQYRRTVLCYLTHQYAPDTILLSGLLHGLFSYILSGVWNCSILVPMLGLFL